MSEQDTTVRHALVGLGAMNDHHSRTRGFRHRPENTALLDLSYAQYGKAIRQLRTSIQSINSASPISAMLVCTLFAVFDFLQGDDLAAAAHLKAGVTILRGFSAGTAANEPSTASRGDSNHYEVSEKLSADMQQRFVKAFSYLDYFSLWWSDGEPVLREVAWIEDLVPHPTGIGGGDIQSLLFHYFELEKRVHELLRIAKITRARFSSRKTSTTFGHVKRQLIEDLSVSFAHCCVLYEQETSVTNRSGQMVLKLNHESLRIMLLACADDGNLDYSPFDSDFESIVSVASSVVDEIVPSTCQFQSFSFSHGLIHPLYIAATCCCNTETCEQAISFLESFTLAEGVWNPQIMAKIARRKLQERVKVKPVM
jgi:hypothetical protein